MPTIRGDAGLVDGSGIETLEQRLPELAGLEEEAGTELERMSVLAAHVEQCLQAQCQSQDAGLVAAPEPESGAEPVRA